MHKPLRGRHAEFSCPTILDRTPDVAADDSVRRCRNYRLHTNLFVRTICRFAEGSSSR